MNFQMTYGYYSSVSNAVHFLTVPHYYYHVSITCSLATCFYFTCTVHITLLTLAVPFMHSISLSNAGSVMCHVMYTISSIVSIFILLAY